MGGGARLIRAQRAVAFPRRSVVLLSPIPQFGPPCARCEVHRRVLLSFPTERVCRHVKRCLPISGGKNTMGDLWIPGVLRAGGSPSCATRTSSQNGKPGPPPRPPGTSPASASAVGLLLRPGATQPSQAPLALPVAAGPPGAGRPNGQSGPSNRRRAPLLEVFAGAKDRSAHAHLPRQCAERRGLRRRTAGGCGRPKPGCGTNRLQSKTSDHWVQDVVLTASVRAQDVAPRWAQSCCRADHGTRVPRESSETFALGAVGPRKPHLAHGRLPDRNTP